MFQENGCSYVKILSRDIRKGKLFGRKHFLCFLAFTANSTLSMYASNNSGLDQDTSPESIDIHL